MHYCMLMSVLISNVRQVCVCTLTNYQSITYRIESALSALLGYWPTYCMFVQGILLQFITAMCQEYTHEQTTSMNKDY